jgi:hypothetical protein
MTSIRKRRRMWRMLDLFCALAVAGVSMLSTPALAEDF